jgi:hypothetical protein
VFVTEVDRAAPKLVPRHFKPVVPRPPPTPAELAAPQRGMIRVLRMPGRFSGKPWPTLLRGRGRGHMVIPCKNRSAYHTLSPMLLGPILDPETDEVWALNIEDAWQGAKVYPHHLLGAAPEDEARWLPAWLEYNRRVRMSGQALRHRATTAQRAAAAAAAGVATTNSGVFTWFRGQHLSYVDARRVMYMPWYEALAEREPAFVDLQRRYRAGEELLIMDPDGLDPERPGDAQYLQADAAEGGVTERAFCLLLRDSTRPFGHGLVLAACLMGYPVWRYSETRLDAVINAH